MHRPKRITLFCLFLGWLSIAGFANSFVMLTREGYGSPMLGVLAGAYGILAATCCVGLWRLNFWGVQAFRVWAALLVILLFVVQFTVVGAPQIPFVVFAFFIAGFLFYINRYLSKVVGEKL